MIYLASTSPRRKKILKELGFAFKVVIPNYEEKNEPKTPPRFLVKKHALAKAISCLSKIKEGIIIGADTVVYCEKKIIGKPKNRGDAFRVLSLLQDRWHMVYTGVSLLAVRQGQIKKQRMFCEKTKVRLIKLSSEDIIQYLKKIDFSDKAGAYAVQSRINIVQEIQGSFSNVVGLPSEHLKNELSYLKVYS